MTQPEVYTEDLLILLTYTYFQVSLIEIPSYVFLVFVMDNIGLKPIFVYSFLLTGTSCLVAGFFEAGAMKTALALIGNGTIVRKRRKTNWSPFPF